MTSVRLSELICHLWRNKRPPITSRMANEFGSLPLRHIWMANELGKPNTTHCSYLKQKGRDGGFRGGSPWYKRIQVCPTENFVERLNCHLTHNLFVTIDVTFSDIRTFRCEHRTCVTIALKVFLWDTTTLREQKYKSIETFRLNDQNNSSSQSNLM